ncbi:MAG: PfkB family carbohydrate kinase [Oscillospiraceae bacterium]|jgi:fructokinase|nr:PfkB family carbohydrate kinase [Oscillospiraceae bacterium]
MKIMTFGEIVWDVPAREGDATLGGAPLNFSAHLAKLGAAVHLISAVGEDELGEKALQAAKNHGIGCDFIRENGFPTGVVEVSGDEGNPQYYIVPNAAYDYIEVPDNLPQDLSEYSFYFGTLAQRSSVSRNTLSSLLSSNSFKKIFCDINIRKNSYDEGSLKLCLQHANILKISRAEIGVFPDLKLTASAVDKRSANENDYMDFCQEICSKYHGVEIIIITLDKDGSMLYDRKQGAMIESEKPQVDSIVDTVGAGDSFGACFFYNYLGGKPLKKCIDRATLLSSYVITQRGAVCDYPDELKEKIVD